jgi:hypothetical protein
MLLLFAISISLIVNQFEFDYLKPISEQGFKSIAQGAYGTVGFPFIEIILLGTVFTFVKQKEKIMKGYLLAVFFAGMILVLTVFVTVGIEGPYMVSRESYSTFAMMRNITVIELFERIEIIIAIVWIFGMLVKITLCLFAALKGLQHITRHESYNPFLFPVGILIWVMSNEIHGNAIDFTDFVTKNWTLWWFTLYLILIVMMIIGIVLKKDKQKDYSSE